MKYSNGAPQISVQVAGATPDTAWVRVKDAGVGIPKAQLGRIFNRFYRFQPQGSKVKGTGLGLYIVRAIAKRHGGRVFAESAGEDKGRPLHWNATRGGACPERASARQRRAKASRRVSRILIVEDEAHLATACASTSRRKAMSGHRWRRPAGARSPAG